MTVKFENEHLVLTPLQFCWPLDHSEIEQTTPFEDVGAALVHELGRVGWEVPGFDITVRSSGRGTEAVRWVSEVSGVTDEGPFRLKFWNRQRDISRHLSQVTGLSEATVPPGVMIRFYGDNSGPSATLFLTSDWAKDGPKLKDVWTTNAALDGRPRDHINYSGRGGRGVLKATGDHREFQPNDDEPAFLETGRVVEQVRTFVIGLLGRLKALPTAPGADDVTFEGDANMRRLAHIEPIPAPADFPILYAWVDKYEAPRAAGWSEDGTAEARDYVLSGNGKRLLSLGARVKVENQRVFDGFSYAATTPEARAGHVIHSVDSESIPVEIKLRWLNEIFVVDNSLFEAARTATFERMEGTGRDRMTDAELDACAYAVAASMVPVTDYDGSYAEPVYVIGRQIRSDEARAMKGPITLKETAEQIRVSFVDKASGRDVELYSTEQVIRYRRNHANEIARFAAHMMTGVYGAPYKTVASDAIPDPTPEPDITDFLTPRM